MDMGRIRAPLLVVQAFCLAVALGLIGYGVVRWVADNHHAKESCATYLRMNDRC